MPGITHTGPCGIKAAHPLTVWKPVTLRNPLYFLVLTAPKWLPVTKMHSLLTLGDLKALSLQTSVIHTWPRSLLTQLLWLRKALSPQGLVWYFLPFRMLSQIKAFIAAHDMPKIPFWVWFTLVFCIFQSLFSLCSFWQWPPASSLHNSSRSQHSFLHPPLDSSSSPLALFPRYSGARELGLLNPGLTPVYPDGFLLEAVLSCWVLWFAGCWIGCAWTLLEGGYYF